MNLVNTALAVVVGLVAFVALLWICDTLANTVIDDLFGRN